MWRLDAEKALSQTCFLKNKRMTPLNFLYPFVRVLAFLVLFAAESAYPQDQGRVDSLTGTTVRITPPLKEA